IKQEDIKAAIDNFDLRKTRYCILYNFVSESESLWTFASVRDFLVVLINTNHPFCKNVITPLRADGQNEALAAIELFIGSLAYEEWHRFSEREEDQKVLSNFRAYVGLHLKRYIDENEISIEDLAGSEASVK
ncbi:MAG: hypothetical protein ACREBJ_11210, partial [Nitrosotalea sp.]